MRQSVNSEISNHPFHCESTRSDLLEDAGRTLSDVSEARLVDYYSDRLSNSNRVKSLGQLDHQYHHQHQQQALLHKSSLGNMSADPHVILINTHPYCHCQQHAYCHCDDQRRCCSAQRHKHRHQHISFDPEPICYCETGQQLDNEWSESGGMRTSHVINVPDTQKPYEQIKMQPKHSDLRPRKIDARWDKEPADNRPTDEEHQTPEAALAAKSAVKKILEMRYGNPPPSNKPTRKNASKLTTQESDKSNNSTARIPKAPELEDAKPVKSQLSVEPLPNRTEVVEDQDQSHDYSVVRNSNRSKTLYNPLTAMNSGKPAGGISKMKNLSKVNDVSKEAWTEESKCDDCIQDHPKIVESPSIPIQNTKSASKSIDEANKSYLSNINQREHGSKSLFNPLAALQSGKVDAPKGPQEEKHAKPRLNKPVPTKASTAEVKMDVLQYECDLNAVSPIFTNPTQQNTTNEKSRARQHIVGTEELESESMRSYHSEREGGHQQRTQSEAKARFANALAHFKANAEETGKYL